MGTAGHIFVAVQLCACNCDQHAVHVAPAEVLKLGGQPQSMKACKREPKLGTLCGLCICRPDPSFKLHVFDGVLLRYSH